MSYMKPIPLVILRHARFRCKDAFQIFVAVFSIILIAGNPLVYAAQGSSLTNPQQTPPSKGPGVGTRATITGTVTGHVVVVSQLPKVLKPAGLTLTVPFNPILDPAAYAAAKAQAAQPSYVPPGNSQKNKVGPNLNGPQPNLIGPQPKYPSQGASWAGIGASGSASPTSETPPDVIGAVGPNHVMEFVNAAGIIYGKGGNVLSGPFTLASFFGTGSDFIGDVYVVYDSIANRWAASVEDFSVYKVSIAYSTSNDPTAGFTVFTNQWSAGSNCADQPFIGTNDDKLALTFNYYSTPCSSSFLGSYWFVLNKLQLLSCNPSIGCNVNYAGGTLSTSSVYTLRPARYLSSSSGVNPANCYYFGDMAHTSTSATAYEVCGLPPQSTSIFSSNTYTISALSTPPSAPQPGTSVPLDTGDNRVLSIVWQMLGGLGVLWLAGSDACIPLGDSTTRSCVRIEALQTDPQFGSSPLEEYEYSSNGRYYLYPALSLNQHGDLMFTAGVSSSTVDPSMIANGRLSTETIGAFESEITLFAGTTATTVVSCTSTCARYGDYFGAGTDPADELGFYLFGEYITQASPAGAWSTGIAHLTFQQSYLVMASSQLWDSSSSIGASMSICRDGSRIAGDLYNSGPTPTNRHLASAFTLDFPNAGSHTYSLCYKTDPGGTGFVSGTFLGLVPLTAAASSYLPSSGPGGDESTTSTSLVLSNEAVGVTNGAGYIGVLLASSQEWDTGANGAIMGICKDGALISGAMQATGASATHRVDVGAVATDVLDGSLHTYSICYRTVSVGTTAFISGAEIVAIFLFPGTPYGNSGVGGHQTTTSTTFTPSGQTVSVSANGVNQYVTIASSMIYDSSSSVGASISICRDGSRVAGDLFTVGATATNILAGTPIFVDTPSSATHIYSLCLKTDPTGTANVQQDSIIYFQISTPGQPIAYLSGPHGDQSTTSTTFVASQEQLTYFVGGNQPSAGSPVTGSTTSQPLTQTASSNTQAPIFPGSAPSQTPITTEERAGRQRAQL
jgi:hypothetical protein